MTISEVLSSAWKALEEEDYRLAGCYERRIFAHSAHSLFAGIARPSNLLQLSLDVSVAQSARVVEEETKGFRLRREHSPITGKARLRLEITNISYRDIFLVVSSDILAKILEVHDERQAVAVLRQRLSHWKRFMQASAPDGLPKSEQIGLFGELLVLRSMLVLSNYNDAALASWQGPHGANQDFIHRYRAIEVKTTASNEPTRVSISNERQLDSHGLSLLVLCHICVDERVQAGMSLPLLVDEITATLATHQVPSFQDSLLEAGYHDSQRHLYHDRGFIERSRSYYKVSGDFPRITPSDLRVGVSEVRYHIDLSGSIHLKDAESQIFDLYFRNDS